MRANPRSNPMPIVAVLAFTLLGCAGPPRPVETGSPPSPSPPTDDAPGVAPLKLRLITEGAVLTATLEDTATTRDFVSLLPLNLTLRDYASTEKVGDLPRRLSTAGAAAGADPEVGDIAYYAPWGNLALYYRDFGYSSGLVKLGRIDSGLEQLARARGEFTVRFELEEAP